MSYDCIIIGAGPAGLMAGNFLKGVHALVLEGEEKPAQKLLLSGGGQCNFTHDGPIEGFYDKFGDRGRFVRKALCGFTNADVMDYMTSRGVPLMLGRMVRSFQKVWMLGMFLGLFERGWNQMRFPFSKTKRLSILIKLTKAIKLSHQEDDI